MSDITHLLQKIAVLLTFLLNFASAQALDLSQAWQLALTNDPLYSAARANYRAMVEKMPQARAALLPQVVGSGTLGYLESRANMGYGQVYQNSNAGWSLTLSQPLFNWSAWQSFEQSKLVVASAEVQLQLAYQELMLRLTQAYFDVLTAQDVLLALQAEQRAIGEQRTSAQRRFDMGETNVTDSFEAQARFDLTAANVLGAENTLQNAKDILARILGQTVESLATLPYTVALPAPQPNVLQQWTDQSVNANLEMVRARLQTRIAEADVEIAKGGEYPTVSAFASTSSNTLGNMQVQPYYNGRTVNNVVGVTLSMPFYTGGMVSSQIAEKNALQQKSVFDLDAVKRQTVQLSQQYFNGVTTGLARIKGLTAVEKSGRASLEANRTGYRLGVRINLDVLNAQQQLYGAQRELATVRYQTVVMGLRLRANGGMLTDADISGINQLLKRN